MTSTTSSSATSGTLSSLGVGSGLDISALVTSLTTAEMSAATSRVDRAQSAVTTSLSAVSKLKSALSTFQTTLSALTSNGSSFDGRKVSSADSSVVTATATSKAAVGSYDVFVTQLAKADQLVSDEFSGGASAVVGTGTLSLSLGSSSFDVTIDSSNNTLQEIRDAINDADDNPGITATLVYGTTGAQLILTSSLTGADNTLGVTQSGGDGGLSVLTYGPGNTGNYTPKETAQDSIISVAGVTHQSSGNTVSDAIDGITLKLISEQTVGDADVSLTVSNDSSRVNGLVQSFVTAYNTLNSTLKSLGSYDSSTEVAGAMFGDSLLTNVLSQISSAMNTPVASSGTTYNSLARLGVTRGLDGSLSLDSTKLTAAMDNDFSAVANTLGGADGVVTKLTSLMENQLASDGSITARTNTLSKQQDKIDEDTKANAARTEIIKARLLAKFNAMDSLLAQLQTTSTYLTQQFTALNKSGS
jgi:flagellar hook-associated protein 2